MPTRDEWGEIRKGQAWFGDIEFKGSKQGQTVQVIPIRGRKTGRVVRYIVSLKRGRRGDGSALATCVMPHINWSAPRSWGASHMRWRWLEWNRERRKNGN